MTDEELKALVAENSLAIRELREESRASRQQWEQYRQESDRRWEQYRLELEQQRQQLEQHQRQFDKHWEEILASRRETDRLVTDLNRELGRLGNKLGRYSESLISPPWSAPCASSSA